MSDKIVFTGCGSFYFLGKTEFKFFIRKADYAFMLKLDESLSRNHGSIYISMIDRIEIFYEILILIFYDDGVFSSNVVIAGYENAARCLLSSKNAMFTADTQHLIRFQS